MIEGAPATPLAKVIDSLAKTRRSVHTVSVCALILCASLEIVTLVQLRLALQREAPEAAMRAFIIAMVLLIGTIPAVSLFRYTQGMGDAIKRRTVDSVEAALKRHKTFWIVNGVLVPLFVILISFVILATIFIPGYQEAQRQAGLRRKMTQTVKDVRRLGEAIERYGHDNHHYPAAVSAAALRALLVPHYIAADVVPVDVWGQPFDYVTRCQGELCSDFALISRGQDGLREQIDEDYLFGDREFSAKNLKVLASLNTVLDRDIIYANGRMIRFPVEMEKK